MINIFLLLRSFAKPPKAVQTVCECVVILRGIREVSWKSAKAMMAEANFLGVLKKMDVDGITKKQTIACDSRSSERVLVSAYSHVFICLPVFCIFLAFRRDFL